jgi:hypothetical protein
VILPPITAPYLAATVLLGVAGIAKAVRPADTATALRTAPALVRTGAVAEIGVAVAALVVPGPGTGALVAASYTAFAVFVVVALRRGWPLSSCGCFGRPDTPPTVAHAALNAAAAAAAVWWAAAWRGGEWVSRLGRLFFHEPWHGGPLALLTVVLAGLAYLVWTDPLPAARA